MNRNFNVNPAEINGIREMMANSGYSNRAINYYLEKPYIGDINNADWSSEMTGTCGDTMKVFLKMNQDKIEDVRYQVMGCAGAVAAAMASVDLVRGKSLAQARRLGDNDVFNLLEEIPEKKHHCIQLAVKALHKTIDEYTERLIK
jgi:nitrogen fixation NifU-like protein